MDSSPLLLDHIVSKINDLLNSPTDVKPNFPLQILPWIYLSSQFAATRYERLKAMGITHVLTMNALPSTEQQNRLEWSFREVGIDQSYVPAYDVEGYKLLEYHWDECEKILRECREANGKIVVHCAMGQNRSALVVGAALMELEGWSLWKTVQHLRSKRGAVLTNQSFRKQLCQLAIRLGQVDKELQLESSDRGIM